MNFVIEEQPKDADGKPIEGAGTIKKNEVRILNSMQPLWAKNKSEIKEEEYTEFYQNLFHDWEKLMEVMHNKIEGNIEYTSLYSSLHMLLIIFIIAIMNQAYSFILAMYSSWINAKTSYLNISALLKV